MRKVGEVYRMMSAGARAATAVDAATDHSTGFGMRQRAALFLLPLAAAALLAGLFVIWAACRAQVVLVEIGGSPPAPSLPSYFVNLTVGGVSSMDYVTTAPAGEAHVAWRYSRPYSVIALGHAFSAVVAPATAMREMSLQYRNDTGHWTEALRAGWSDENLQQWHGFTVPAPHNAVVARDWRVVAISGGSDQLTTIGWINPTRGSGGVLDKLLEVKFESLVVALVFACGIPLGLAFRRGSWLIFVLACIAVTAASNLVFFGLAKSILTWFPDSGSYWQWPPHPQRPAGFGLLLHFVVEQFGLEGLHYLQFNLVLCSYILGLACIAKATGRYLLLTPFVFLPLAWGNFAIQASSPLTEPWFMSALLLTAVGLVGVILSGRRRMAALSGFGLALAVIAKPVGMVFFVPVLLAYRFLPGRPRVRILMIATILLPASAIQLGQAVYGLQLNGRFASQSGSGHALAAHVAWMLDPNHLEPAYRSAGQSVVDRVAQVYASAPPITKPQEFAQFSTQNYNLILGEIVAPLMAQRLLELEGNVTITPQEVLPVRAEWRRPIYIKLNDILIDWSVAAIKADPVRYLAYCAIHYWALWRDSLDYYLTLGRASAMMLPRAEVLQHQVLGKRPWRIEAFESYYDRGRDAVRSGALAVMQLKHFEWRVGPNKKLVATVLMALALGLSALYLLPVRYPPVISAMVICCLLVNAYLAGQALFQVSLVRYAEVIIPLVALIAALGAVALRDAIGGAPGMALRRIGRIKPPDKKMPCA